MPASKQEMSDGYRSQKFSNWHRKKMPQKAYATDMDFVEYDYRNNEPRALLFMDLKQWAEPDMHVADAAFAMMQDMANKSGSECIRVRYHIDDNLKMHRVVVERDGSEPEEFTEDRFIDLVMRLRKEVADRLNRQETQASVTPVAEPERAVFDIADYEDRDFVEVCANEDGTKIVYDWR